MKMMWAQYLTKPAGLTDSVKRLGYWLDSTEFNFRLRQDIFFSQQLQDHLWASKNV